MNQVGESGVVKRVGSEAELQSKGSVGTQILQILAALHNQFGAIRAFFRCNWGPASVVDRFWDRSELAWSAKHVVCDQGIGGYVDGGREADQTFQQRRLHTGPRSLGR